MKGNCCQIRLDIEERGLVGMTTMIMKENYGGLLISKERRAMRFVRVIELIERREIVLGSDWGMRGKCCGLWVEFERMADLGKVWRQGKTRKNRGVW